MPDLLLTFHCATRDVETVVAAIRAASQAPIHIQNVAVRGRDFSDARTAERVTGNLDRSAIELIVADDAMTELVRAVAESRRDLPVRWRAVAIVARGRLA